MRMLLSFVVMLRMLDAAAGVREVQLIGLEPDLSSRIHRKQLGLAKKDWTEAC